MKTPLLSIFLGMALGAWFSQAHAAMAPGSEAKALYVQAKDRADVDYDAARERCKQITGNPRDVCIAEAKAARVRTEQEASALYRNTLKDYTQSRLKIASANYDRDKVKCAALTGNDKDVCIKQAKSTLIASQADARADKKAIEARADARDDKRQAEYKVALEKCDAFAGAAKDSCVVAAKSQYGK